MEELFKKFLMENKTLIEDANNIIKNMPARNEQEIFDKILKVGEIQKQIYKNLKEKYPQLLDIGKM